MQDLDLNNYMTAGLYVSNQSYDYTNVPSGSSENRYFSLQVIRETTEEPNCYRQILYKYRDNTIYFRDYRWTSTGGFSWSEWEQLATKSDLTDFPKMKATSFFGTSDNNGNISLESVVSNSDTVVAIRITQPTYCSYEMCMVNGVWYIRVFQNDYAHSPLSNVTVGIIVTYY